MSLVMEIIKKYIAYIKANWYVTFHRGVMVYQEIGELPDTEGTTFIGVCRKSENVIAPVVVKSYYGIPQYAITKKEQVQQESHYD